MEQLNDHYVGQMQQELEVVQCPEWKDIADWSPICKSY
jgi:hypothetical protein